MCKKFYFQFIQRWNFTQSSLSWISFCNIQRCNRRYHSRYRVILHLPVRVHSPLSSISLTLILLSIRVLASEILNLGSCVSLRRSTIRWIRAKRWSRKHTFSFPISWQWFANSLIFCRAFIILTSMQFDNTIKMLFKNHLEIVTLNNKPKIEAKYQTSSTTNIGQYFCITVWW